MAARDPVGDSAAWPPGWALASRQRAPAPARLPSRAHGRDGVSRRSSAPIIDGRNRAGLAVTQVERGPAFPRAMRALALVRPAGGVGTRARAVPIGALALVGVGASNFLDCHGRSSQ